MIRSSAGRSAADSAAPELPLTIMPTPAHQAPSAPAAYYLSQGKGNPGLFYVNTFNLAERPTYQIDTLLLHEVSTCSAAPTE